MPEKDVSPLYMTDAVLSESDTDYAKAISIMQLVPSASSTTKKGLKPDAVWTFAAKATWVLNLTFAQDWETTGSFSEYLFNNEGQKKTFVIEPSTGGRTVTVEVYIVPGQIGGTVDTAPDATVALPVIGKPVLGAIPVGP